MKSIKYWEAIRDAIKEEMIRDESIFMMGEDIGLCGGVFGCTKGLFNEFGPDRIRNTPISEAATIGAGVGAAMTGGRIIVEMQYIDFIMCAMDQVVNQAAKARYMSGGKATLPLTIRGPQGSGRANGAQHSQSIEAWFMHVPGIKIAMPSTPYDAKGLLKTAIRDDNPVIFLEHKVLYNTTGEVPEEEYAIPFGIADIKREGKDVTIIATSWMVLKALEAAKDLSERGIDAEVIDPRTLMPLDKETIIHSVIKTGRVVIVHEAHKICGIGAEIASVIMEEAFTYLDAPVERIGSRHAPFAYNRRLENLCTPQKEDIIRAVEKVLYI